MKPLRFIVTLLFTLVASAQEKPVIVMWTAQDVNGTKVTVPAEGKISIVAFLRGEQSQSKDALEALKATVADAKDSQVVIVVSGPAAAREAKTLVDAKCPWPVVADTEFEASGKMGAHVWPTTVIVRSDGRQAGHLAGLPASYATDLAAYVKFAQDKIDQQMLDHQLNNHALVQDSAGQAAQRHLQVALRLLDNAEPAKAADEIEQGLKLAPTHVPLLLAKAQALVADNQPKSALAVLDAIPAGQLPAWQLAVAKGRALVAAQRWDEAKAVLPEAIKLNPSPAEAHYLLGVTYQNLKDFKSAAQELRQAIEMSHGTTGFALIK